MPGSSMLRSPKAKPAVALIMSGGGARAAYQVGVLRAISKMLPPGARNPFVIICGTSAGAINAASLASNADRFDIAVRRLSHVWGNLRIGEVFRADALAAIRSVWRCLWMLPGGRLRPAEPFSLLDCRPLSRMLGRLVNFRRIDHMIASGHLSALGVTASSYQSGESVTFFQGNGTQRAWTRAHRTGRQAVIGLEHVLASASLPVVFPVVRIGEEHFGDGSMHQLAPTSAALHLGAERLLVIGVGSASREEQRADNPDISPSLAQIIGHVLDSIFVDTLDMDLERLNRVNQTLSYIPRATQERHGPELRPIDALVIRPSERLDLIASTHARELPPSIRFLFKRLGALEPNGARVLSYLLFERGYCRRLIQVGFADAMRQRTEILRLLGYAGAESQMTPDLRIASG
jgi:NTE family protein